MSKTLNILCIGQSNMCFSGKGLNVEANENVKLYNRTTREFDNFESPVQDGDYFASANAGDSSTFLAPLGNLLSEYYDEVNFVNIGVGGTTISQWATELVERAEEVKHIEFDYVIFHQGESDTLYETSKDNYKQLFKVFYQRLYEILESKPKFLLSEVSYIDGKWSNDIIEAQQELKQELNLFDGIETDDLKVEYRHDGAHFNKYGLTLVAARWFNALMTVSDMKYTPQLVEQIKENYDELLGVNNLLYNTIEIFNNYKVEICVGAATILAALGWSIY